MKQLLLITALVGGIAASGFSQEGRPRIQREPLTPEERARRYTEALDRRLNLTDKQEREVYQLELKQVRKQEKSHLKMKKRHEKARRARNAEREAAEKRLHRILSEDQRAAYNQLRENRKERLHSRQERIKNREKRGSDGSFRNRE